MKNSLIASVFLGLALLVFASGCAWYQIKPVSSSELKKWPPKKSGYVIYQPELYFAATVTTGTSTNADKTQLTKQDVTVAPIYLPNVNRAYQVTTHNVLGKADFTFNFENGWKLTQISDKSDNTTIANTLAGQLQTVLKAAGVAGIDSGVPQFKTRVILYKPEYDKNGCINGFTEKGTIELDNKSGSK